MLYRPALFVLLLSVLSAGLISTGCRSALVQDRGPAIAQTSVALGVQVALSHAKAEPARVAGVLPYLQDARVLLQGGEANVTVLDGIAASLNERVPWPVVRQAIQQGILTLKQYAAIPLEGRIGPKATRWIYALLDGVIEGCQAYLAANPNQTLGAAPQLVLSVPDQVSFR